MNYTERLKMFTLYIKLIDGREKTKKVNNESLNLMAIYN